MSIGVCLGSFTIPFVQNNMNQAIKPCKVHHFTHDTNLLYTNSSTVKLNKLLNKDLKHLNDWLKANKIYWNVDKTEMILFKPTKKPFRLPVNLN